MAAVVTVIFYFTADCAVCMCVCVLNCRNVEPSAYNSPVAYPQPASTALPMDYGQGLLQTVDSFVVGFSDQNVVFINHTYNNNNNNNSEN